MKKILFLILFVLCSINIFANDSLAMSTKIVSSKPENSLLISQLQSATKKTGDEAYINNDFTKASKIYEYILSKNGKSAEIYYNLGNCYYKMNFIAKAIINYERALLLSPGDADIRFNLEIARSKTVDKVGEVPQFFIITWVQAIINFISVDAWAIFGVVFFIIFISGLSIYIFSRKIVYKKISFLGSLLSLTFAILSYTFAYIQNERIKDCSNAIIVTSSVTVKSTPNALGTDLFIIHEGRKVILKDTSMKDWKEIKLEDGNVGWVKTTDIEII